MDQGYTIAEAARSLEIRANMLGRWIKEYQADDNGQSFRRNGKLTPEGGKQATQARETDIKGSGGLLCERNEVKFSFITQKKKTYPVGLTCRLLGVSRSAYYAYARHQASFSDDSYHAKLIDVIRDIAESRAIVKCRISIWLICQS